MKYILASAALLFCLALPVKAQFVPDCANCTNASWGEEWSATLGVCINSTSMGCGNHCNCAMGLMAVVTVKNGKATATTDFFGGAITPDGGFRIDRPGPLARNHVKPGDIAWRINGRWPKRAIMTNPKRLIRRAEATWDDSGRLHLKLFY